MALKYSDLEIIADETIWPFNKYWRCPSREQINEGLKGTMGWFKKLPRNEEEILKNLDAIFMNIALVSVVLRFVLPEHYAIYSPPPLQILRIERGGDSVEDYLNYVRELRILRKSFGVSKTADVDTIVWAISQEKGEYLADFKKILADELPENLTPFELIAYSRSPLKIADTYLKKHDDFRTAALWAAKAFEEFLQQNCLRIYGFIPERTDGELESIIYHLCQSLEFIDEKETLHLMRKTRNRFIHGFRFDKEDVARFLNRLRALNRSKKP